MSVLKFPEATKFEISKRLRTCLWQKSEFSGRCKALAAWDSICKPKVQGGLRCPRSHYLNGALVLKHLHKFFNRLDIPWVNLVWEAYRTYESAVHASFWWRNIVSLASKLKGSASCALGDGHTVPFWMDDWCGEQLCSSMFSSPCMFTFLDVSPFSKNSYATVQEVANMDDPSQSLQPPPVGCCVL